VDQNKKIPKTIGKYKIIKRIGKGGMGIVYHAFEPVLNRDVAIKILPPNVAGNEKVLSRFRHEARSAALLHHPNITTLYEFSCQDNSVYLVMEYVAGKSLEELLADGPLPIQKVIDILDQIGEALDYAHSLGVIHRDVKPSNILISDNDRALLADFGLAHAKDNSLITPEGSVVGTPYYMSTEQAAGKTVSKNSDQYSLATVAYEMLSSSHPFDYPSSAAVIHAHIYEIPPDVTENNTNLPQAVNYVFAKALNKNPDNRYKSNKEFVQELNKALLPSVNKRKDHLKNRLYKRLVAFCLVIAISAVLLLKSDPARSFLNLPTKSAIMIPNDFAWSYDPGFAGGPELVSSNGTLIVENPNGQITALNADDGTVLWKTDQNEKKYASPSANSLLVFAGNNLEGLEGLSLSTGGTVWQTEVTGKIQDAPVVFQNKLIAATTKGYIYIVNAGNGLVIWSRPFELGIRSMNVTSKYLLICLDYALYALDIENGMVVWEFTTESQITTQPVIAEDSVLIGSDQGIVYFININNGYESYHYQANGSISVAPAVHEEIAFIPDQAGVLAAVNIKNRKIIWEYQTNYTLQTSPIVYNDYIFIASSNGEILILDKENGKSLNSIPINSVIKTNLIQENDYIFLRTNIIFALKF
jgi:serine/threonine protein kinase